uniref:beta-alanine-activating enzyme isoform X2 n=1 Tax=Ciona intestinalis TaxID=7719 RepID=UPI00089DC65E|nr:beta-alanine-activating enzyme isoform X2 [Ciona intestinalis]|eukprot:XP_018673187.1 beta-alanine-activating enzyme isoform X2 [Ciona intestinalis]
MRLETLFNEAVKDTPSGVAVEFFDEDLRKGKLTYEEVASLADEVRKLIQSHVLRTQDGVKCPEFLWSTTKNAHGDKKVENDQCCQHFMCRHVPSNKGCISKRVIGLYIEPSLFLPSLVIGVLQSGCSFAPIDPNAKFNSKKDFMKAASVSCVITSISNASNVKSILGDCKMIPLYWNLQTTDFILCLSEINRGDTFIPTKLLPLAYTLHTSGTTGKPKIVKVPHKSILPNIVHLKRMFQVGRNDKVAMVSPLTFDPCIVEMFIALSSGATLVIPQHVLKQRPSLLCEVFFKLSKVTIIQPTPCLMNRFCLNDLQNFAFASNSSVRLVALVGEACPSCKTISSWINPILLAEYSRNKEIIKFPRFYNIYGITEVSSWATLHEIPVENIISCLNDPIPLGLPLCSTKLEISNGNQSCVIQSKHSLEHLLTNQHSTGFASEVIFNIGDKHEFTGLLKIGGSERACVVLDNVGGSRTETLKNPMHSSGDMVTVVIDKSRSVADIGKQTFTVTGDVKLFYLGRKDGQIKRNGKRMNILTVKQKLESFKLCSVAHVLNVSPEMMVELRIEKKQFVFQSARLIAFVVLANTSEEMRENFRKRVKDVLDAHLVPDDVKFVDDLPLTTHGKVNDKDLIQRYLESITKARKSDILTMDCIRNILKKSLCKIFNKTFNEIDFFQSSDNLFTSNFITLGGDSFGAVKLISMLEACMTPPNHGQLLQVILNNTLEDVVTYLHKTLLQNQSKNPTNIKQIYDNDFKSVIPLKRKADVNTVSLKVPKPVTRDVSMPLKVVSVARGGRVYRHSADMELHSVGKSEPFTCTTELTLEEVWKHNTRKCVDASPLVIVSDENGLPSSVIIGSHSHYLVCLNLMKGNVEWETKLGGRIESSACLTPDGHYVVVGCYDGNVYALHVKHGLVYWKFFTGSEVKSSPCPGINGSVIYIGSHSGSIHCLDIKVHDPSIIVCSLAGRVLSLYAENGRRSWCLNLGKPIFSSPSVSESGIFVACVDCCLYKLDHISGDVTWSYQTMEPIFSSPTVASTPSNNVVFIGSHDGNLYCINADTGSKLWEFPSSENSSVHPIYATPFPICSNNMVKYISSVSTNGLLSLLDVKSGRVVAQKSLSGDVFSSPIFIGREISRDGVNEPSKINVIGHVVVGCRNNNVYSFALTNKSNVT